jgi:hypothetical protein
MKPFLLKEVIKDLDESSSLLNTLLSDSEELTKTLFIKDGDWSQSVHWKMGKIVESLQSHKRVLQKIYDILPPEAPSKGKEMKESQFFGIIADFNVKLEKIMERLKVLESEKVVFGSPVYSEELKSSLPKPKKVVKSPKPEPEPVKKKRGRPKQS